jgi:hypothetical protein
MVGGVDPARKVEVEVEQGDRGRLIVLTIWVGNLHPRCSDPCSDHARVHAQNRGRCQRYPHPHCRPNRSCKEKVSQLVQLVTATGLLDSWQDQDLVLGCWLVDKGICNKETLYV